MASEFMFPVVQADFDEHVIEASKTHLVLVDFWAGWCSPCRMLMPILDKLATEHAGQFTVAKVDTDNEAQLARQYNIRSLPTVIFFKNGEVVDQFMGAQPESAIRQILNTHLG